MSQVFTVLVALVCAAVSAHVTYWTAKSLYWGQVWSGSEDGQRDCYKRNEQPSQFWLRILFGVGVAMLSALASLLLFAGISN